MNKTININLGGVFFHIDEDAYKKLKIYLDAIRKSLSDDPQGKDEILKDIEIRIGEILSDSVKDVRQVVNEQDIDDIILIMGKPEEYAGDEEFFEDESYSKKSKNRKKLFRDTEDKFLGGVSSGLSHYFGIDVIWIRLTWLLLLIGGFSVVLYPILWILLPQANSTSEKLEMEGSDVNISNIERKIKEGFNDASQLFKDGVDDVSKNFKKGDYQHKMRSGLQEMIDLITKVYSEIFKVAGKFIGVLLIVVSVLTLFSILIGGFSLGSIEFLGLTDELTQYPPFFHTSRIPLSLLVLFGFIAIAIPFVLLFKLGLKIISNNVNKFSRPTNLSLLGVWLLSVMALAFAGIEYGAHSLHEFSKSDRFVIEHLNTKDTLNIKMIALDDFEPRRYFEDKTTFINETQVAYKTNISFDIRESNNSELYIRTYKKANGISINKAKELVKDIRFKYEVVNNTLMLDAYFLANLKNQNNSQYVRITLFVPKGMTIYLDKTNKSFIKKASNTQNIRSRHMIKRHFKMTNDGLDCLDCDDKNKKNKISVKFEGETSKENKNITTSKIKKTVRSNEDAEEIHKEIKRQLEK